VSELELLKLIEMCSANYRNWPEKGKEEDVIRLWTILFSDVDPTQLRMAVQNHIFESTFPPTVADIREQIAKTTLRGQKTGIEAWGEVKSAIRRFGVYNEEKAVSSLQGTCRRVVELMGFRELCMSENEMADRAHFLKVYESLVSREKEEIKNPALIESVLQRLPQGVIE